MFSTSTIGSSTSSPSDRINAKSVTRLIVKPSIRFTASVSPKTTGTATATISASRHPRPKRQQGDDDQDGHRQALDQFIDLLVGGQAVVAGDDQFHVVGHDRLSSSSAWRKTALATQTALEPFFLAIAMVTAGFEPALVPTAGICRRRSASPRTVPGKNSCCVKPARRPPAVAHVAGDFLRAVLDAGHVLEEDRPAIEHAHHQVAQLPGIVRRAARLHANHLVLAAEVAGRLPHVRALDRPLQFQGRHVIRRHPVRVHEHLHHPRPAAHDVGPRHVLHRRQPLRDFLGHPPQASSRRQCALVSVSVTIGTSSISTGLTTQPVTPGGTMSRFSSIFF